MAIAKLILPKEKLFYIAFNVSGKPLYIHTIDPVQQDSRDKWLRSVETSFLREDVEHIEVWQVEGPHGLFQPVETFTPLHPDLHFTHCECGCDKRVFTTSRYARCQRCQRFKCDVHGKFHHKTNASLCVACYDIALLEG